MKPMVVKKSIILECKFEEAVAAVRKSSLLFYVASPLIAFSPVKDPIPDVWVEGTHWVKLKLFGLIPMGKQAIVISFAGEKSTFILRDNGHSPLISKWDHTITIEKVSENQTRYEDRVIVHAGIITPIVWLFARQFYSHRQKRWLELCSNRFKSVI